MNEIQLFQYQSKQVRTIIKDEQIWFVAKDVCEVLEIVNCSDATSDLDSRDKNTIAITDGNRGNPNVIVISESGVYSLVFKSRKPEALKFQRWVTSEVLPSIRKHGMYMTPPTMKTLLENPEEFKLMVDQYVEEYRRRKVLEVKVEALSKELGFTTDYASFKRVAIATGRKEKDFSWRKLKKAASAAGLEVRKVEDPNFGTVNTYPASAWLEVYGIDLKKLRE